MVDKIELLYDHYKDTCEIQRNNLRIRNTAFVIVIVFLGFLLLLSYYPEAIDTAILSFFDHEYGIDVTIRFEIIQSLVWVILLYSSMRYYQVTIYIERIYKYIYKTEKQLNDSIADKNIIIDREGKSYLSNYPKCSIAMDYIYKWFFPVLYIIAITIKIFAESANSFAFILDMFLFFVILVLCILFICFNYQIVKSYNNQLLDDNDLANIEKGKK